MNRIECDRSVSGRKILPPLRAATLVSFFLSSVAAFVCLLFAGAGHGAASPGLVYFAPLFVYPELGQTDSAASSTYMNFAVVLIFIFYCVYGIAISIGRLYGHGKLALALVLIFHYCGVGVCFMSDDWDGTRNIWIVSEAYGGWISVFLVELFVMLHLLAFQYAWSEIPYCLEFTRRVTVILCVGLAAGILFYVLTDLQAKY